MNDPSPAPPPLSVRTADALLRLRFPILLAVAVATGVLLVHLLGLRAVWNEYEELPPTDPDLVSFEKFMHQFGGEEFLIVALQAENVFDPQVLRHLQVLTEALHDLPHATEVVSLATMPVLRGTGEDARLEPFLDEVPDDPEALARLRAEALTNRLWVGNLVSADGRTASINVLLPAMTTDANQRIETVTRAREILAAHPLPGVTATMTGVSPLVSDVLETILRDVTRFLWLTPVLILVFLYLAFGTLRGVAAPTLVIGLSVVWTMGLMALAGGTLNMGTSTLPTLIAVNCLTYTIHTLNAYYESAARDGDRRKVIVSSLAHMLPAIFMAAATTAVGFASNGISPIRTVQYFGAFAGAGVLVAALLCLTLVPISLSWLPLPPRTVQRHRGRRSINHAVFRFASFANRDRSLIPTVFALLIALSLYGISRIRVQAEWSRHLPASAPSVQGLRVVERDLAGFYMLELILEGPPGTFREPWALREADRLAQFTAKQHGVDQVLSLADLLRETHRRRAAEGAASDGLPDTRGPVDEYLLLYSIGGQDRVLHSLITPDASALHVNARVQTLTTTEHLALVRHVEDYARRHLDRRLTLQTTGLLKLFSTKADALVRSLLNSFLLSAVLIAAMMMVTLRSFRAGLVAMIPNILPVFLTFGLMGFAGIPLNAATVMIASIAIGISVDDTIHFLLRYRRECRPGRSAETAIRRTLLGTGRAMVYAAFVLAAGFSILLLSSFRLNREFGLLTAFAMLTGLLSDLLLTPWLTRRLRLLQ